MIDISFNLNIIMEKNKKIAEGLGFDKMYFHSADIGEFDFYSQFCEH